MARLLPYDLFLFDEKRELVWQSATEGIAPESPCLARVEPGNCKTCLRLQADCPLNGVFLDGRPVRLTVDSQNGAQQLELQAVALDPERGRKSRVMVMQKRITPLESDLGHMRDELTRRVHQLDIINQLLAGLQQTVDQQQMLYVLLSSLTFGKGLQFNRAFYFERAEDEIAGRMALGPIDGEEANRIWQRQDLGQLSLAELLHRHEPEVLTSSIQKMVGEIRFHNSMVPEYLRKALESEQVAHIERPAQPEAGAVCLLAMTGSHEAWLAPVRRPAPDIGRRWIGFILVDNLITGRKPSRDHLESLSTCAYHLGFALERNRLNNTLRRKIEQLEALNEALAQSRANLIRAEKMAAVGRMTSNLAHELKTPVVAIGGFSRRLQKELKGSRPKLAERADIIYHESMRVERILDALLDYADPQVLRKVELDVLRLLQQTVERMSEEFRALGIKTELNTPARELILWGDPVRLGQLFRSLMQNVLDLNLEAPGSCSRLDIRLTVNDEALTLVFSDDGPGISPTIGEQVFEPFYTTRNSALGLGLPLAREIADQHGGTVRLRALEPGGRGAIFEIQLPWRYHGEDPVRR